MRSPCGGAACASSSTSRAREHRPQRGARVAPPHRPALAGGPLPAVGAPCRGRGPGGDAPTRVGEDGRPGLARAPCGRGCGWSGLWVDRARRGPRGARRRASSPARCYPRSWPRPSCPGSADPGNRRSCCRAWPTAPSRRRSCSAAAASTPSPPPAVRSGSAGRCVPCSVCPGRGCSSRRSMTEDGSSSTVPAPTTRSWRRSSPGSMPPGPSPCSPSTASSSRRPSRSGPPTSSSAASASCSARPRARESRAGASKRPRSTRRCGCSSAARSASSRRSSTRWPTCWSPWSSAPPWRGTPPWRGPKGTERTEPIRPGPIKPRPPTAPDSRRSSPDPWRSPRQPDAPSSASRRSAASGSPGSTTRTCTSSAPWRTCSCWRAGTKARWRRR